MPSLIYLGSLFVVAIVILISHRVRSWWRNLFIGLFLLALVYWSSYRS